MFLQAYKDKTCWLLTNSWGHRFKLTCREDYSGCEIDIGVMGTRTRAAVRGSKDLPKTKALQVAKMFEALRKPIYLIDVRRNGVGGQGSWSPREFATIIPEALPRDFTYAYIHLPCLAPSIALLDDYRKGGSSAAWRVFRQRYLGELSSEILDVARAFVESAATKGGLAVFLCAEADQPEFDNLPPMEQDAHYCHRFTLAKQVANRMKAAYDNVSVKLVHQDLLEFSEQWKQSSGYCPRESSL